MPFYEGVTLKERLRQLGSPPDERWLMALLGRLANQSLISASCARTRKKSSAN